MDSIDEGDGLELSYSSEGPGDGAENWTASLYRLVEAATGTDSVDRLELATARLRRVSLDDPKWFDALDAESADLAVVGAPFQTMEAVVDVDENAPFADSLVIIDEVYVPPVHRGARASIRLARAVARIFRSDVVALLPAQTSANGPDPQKEAGLRRHWERAGFQTLPGLDVMVLPIADR